MKSNAYPTQLLDSSENGIYWAETVDTKDVECAINNAIEGDFSEDCKRSRKSYEDHFSNKIVQNKLAKLVL